MADETAASTLQAMRAAPPLVHCITNYVAMNFAANALLAAGAAPAMVHAAEESADFARISGALTINIGTLDPYWVEGMEKAVSGTQDSGIPWVLDPVGHFATPYRAQVAKDLLALGPTVLRGNASEIMALAGESSAGRGVDAGDDVAAAEGAARRLANASGCVVAVTGAVDFVTDGARDARISGGSPVMPQVTAMGCALTAVTGAYLATTEDPLSATIGALAHFAEAGSEAHSRAKGPGSFSMHFLDALAAVSPDDIDPARVVLS